MAISVLGAAVQHFLKPSNVGLNRPCRSSVPVRAFSNFPSSLNVSHCSLSPLLLSGVPLDMKNKCPLLPLWYFYRLQVFHLSFAILSNPPPFLGDCFSSQVTLCFFLDFLQSLAYFSGSNAETHRPDTVLETLTPQSKAERFLNTSCSLYPSLHIW